MAKITIPNKNTGDSHTASEFNTIKDSVNALYSTVEAHKAVLTFNTNKFTATAISQSGAINYVLNTTGNIDLMVIRHKIMSDGTNPITFSSDFNVFNKSENDIYPSGLHIFYFSYVGGEVDVVIPTYSVESTTPTEPTDDTEAPSIPNGLSSSNIGETSFTLSWNASTDNVGVTGYKIYKNGSFDKQVSSTSTSITGLTAETSYNFTVSAIDAAGNESSQSTALQITTDSAQVSPFLVSHYPMNETSGTEVIDIVGGHNGTVLGTVGRDGSEYTFNSDGHIEIPDNDDHTFVENTQDDVPFTISMDIEFPDLTLRSHIINRRDSNGDEWLIEYDVTKQGVQVDLHPGGSNTGAIGGYFTGIEEGVKKELKITYTGGLQRADIKMYWGGTPLTFNVDGANDYSGMINTNSNTYIGKRGTYSSSSANMKMSNLKIYKGAVI